MEFVQNTHVTVSIVSIAHVADPGWRNVLKSIWSPDFISVDETQCVFEWESFQPYNLNNIRYGFSQFKGSLTKTQHLRCHLLGNRLSQWAEIFTVCCNYDTKLPGSYCRITKKICKKCPNLSDQAIFCMFSSKHSEYQ